MTPIERWIEPGAGAAPIHLAEWSGAAGGPSFLLVHGLGGSHWNWAALAPALGQLGPVTAIDLPGFGRSPPPPGRRVTIASSRAAVAAALDQLAAGPRILVGNSLGGTVALLEAAARDDLDGLVLIDPALPMVRGTRIEARLLLGAFGMMLPLFGPWLVRRWSRRDSPTQLLLPLVCHHPERVPAEVVAAHEALAATRSERPWMDRAVVTAARSLVWACTRRLWFRRQMRRIRAPVLFLHGQHDRLIHPAVARDAARRFPAWTVSVLDEAGHSPQLDAADAVFGELERWLPAALPRTATSA